MYSRCAILSSGACLSMISVERVVAIKSLDRASTLFTFKKTVAYMVILWILLISFQLLPAFKVWHKIGHRPGHPYCTIWKSNEDTFFYPDTLIYFFGYFTPLIVLIVSYSMIYKQLNDYTFRSGKEGQVTKSAIIMIGSFVFIYTPGMLNHLFNKLSEDKGMPELASAALVIAWSHAFINPIIFFFCNSFYRNEYLITLKLKQKPVKNSNMGSRSITSSNAKNRITANPNPSKLPVWNQDSLSLILIVKGPN